MDASAGHVIVRLMEALEHEQHCAVCGEDGCRHCGDCDSHGALAAADALLQSDAVANSTQPSKP